MAREVVEGNGGRFVREYPSVIIRAVLLCWTSELLLASVVEVVFRRMIGLFVSEEAPEVGSVFCIKGCRGCLDCCPNEFRAIFLLGICLIDQITTAVIVLNREIAIGGEGDQILLQQFYVVINIGNSTSDKRIISSLSCMF